MDRIYCWNSVVKAFFVLFFYYKLVVLTWGEDVRVEANVKRCVADWAYSFASIQDHLTAFRIWLW